MLEVVEITKAICVFLIVASSISFIVQLAYHLLNEKSFNANGHVVIIGGLAALYNYLS